MISEQSTSSSEGEFCGEPQFALAHLTVLACAPPEATRIAARTGYDYISLRTIPVGLPGEPSYRLANDPAMLRETKAALAATGMKTLDAELARIVDGVDVKTYFPELEVAAELGFRHIVSSVWTPNRNYAIESLAELCELTAKLGLTMDLEFVTWSNLTDLRQAAAMIREVNKPNLGLLIDTLHFDRSRVRIEELASIPRNWLHFVHLADGPAERPSSKEEMVYTAREARLDPGEGGIDLAAIVNSIPHVPYSLELPNFERVEKVGYEEHARLALANAKKYLADHPRQLVAR